MLTFLSWIGSFLSGPIISALAKGWADHESAVNTGAQIEATKAVQLAQVQAQIDAVSAQVVIAEQGRWWTALIRPVIATPIAVFIWKVVVWDTVLKLGHTDALTPEMYGVMNVVIASYFGYAAFMSLGRVLAGRK